MPQFDRPIQRSMALGEQSPNLSSRADLDRWRASLALCQNCVTIPQGGATKRSGSQLVKEALAGSELYEFRYSRSDGYAIEAAANKFRFFRDYGVIESAPGVPYELATPFSADEAAALSTTQSADVMFIASGARTVQKLKRFGHTNWTIADAAFKNGPFMDDNADETISLYTIDGTELVPGTSVEIRAFPNNSAVFTAANVGSYFLIRERDESDIQPWVTDKPYTVGDFVRNGENVYKSIKLSAAGDHSGPNQPIHTTGASWDGSQKGNLWQYCHSGFGIVKVTGFLAGAKVQVTVISYVPRSIQAAETGAFPAVTAISHAAALTLTSTGGTNRWAEGAWSIRRGYPRVVVMHQDRLLAFSTPFQPNRYWASCTDDFENFLAGSDGDLSFSRQLNGGDGVSEILWAISAGLGLVMGSTGPEFVTRSLTNSGYLKPDDVQDIPATSEGAAAVQPKTIDGPVFVSADGLRVMAIGFDPESNQINAFKADDLTIFADHITRSGIVDLAWQRDPYRLLWCLRADGTLIALTYRKDQQVMGWHRHPMLFGAVKSIASVPSPSGIRQDLWLRVQRPLAAGTKTYIECLRPFFERTAPDANEQLHAIDGWFVDAGVMYDGAPVTTVTGLADFNGQSLWVFADGKFQGAKTPAAGAITLDRAASKVLVGIPFDARVRTLKYDRNFDGGANSGRKQRVPEPTALLRNSAMVEASAMWGDATEPLIPTGGQAMDTAPDLFNGVAKASVAADWDTGGDIQFVSTGPFPMTIQAITPVTEVAVN